MRLPDFFFGRDQTREEAEGLRLAGVLVTDFATPKDSLFADEWQEIMSFVDDIVAAVDRDPNVNEIGYWRGVPPSDGLASPYPEEAVRERMVGHLVLSIEVDQDGGVYVVSSECAATREEVDTTIRQGLR